jgi:hypothetical protein
MAVRTVTATFTGAEQAIDVAWSGVGAAHHISRAVLPSDGWGAISPWLTNHSAGGATINVPALWQGTVVLTVSDAATLTPWPSLFTVSDLISAADAVHGTVGPLGTPLSNIIAMRLPASVSTMRVQFGNRVLINPGSPVAGQPSSPITGAKLAVGPISLDGQSWTGPITEIDAITLPANGDLYTSPIINVAGLPNANGEVGVSWSVPAGTTFFGEQPGYFGYGSTNENIATPSGLVPVNINPLFVSPYYQVPSTFQRVIIIGDSLTRSLSSTFGDSNGSYKQALGWLIGGRPNTVCNRAAGSGQSLVSWADQVSHPWLWDFQFFAGAIVIIWLGTNDVNAGVATAADMLAALQTICQRVLAAGAFKVIGTTVAPSATYSGAQNTTRSTYNAGVLAKPYGISAVLDVDAELRDSGAPNSLQTPYACADLIHLTAAANTALFNRAVANGFV